MATIKQMKTKSQKSKEKPALRMSLLIESKRSHKEASLNRNRSENSSPPANSGLPKMRRAAQGHKYVDCEIGHVSQSIWNF